MDRRKAKVINVQINIRFVNSYDTNHDSNKCSLIINQLAMVSVPTNYISS